MKRSKAFKRRNLNEIFLVGGLAGIFAIYLSFSDRMLIFDGVLFSSIIEKIPPGWEKYLLNPRHLLFNPFMLLVRDILALCGIEVRAYPMIQRLNALLGAVGIGLYFEMLVGMSIRRSTSAFFALLLAFSFGYWSRASEGQVYMLMTFCGLTTISFALTAVRNGKGGLMLFCAYFASVLFHAANAVLLPTIVIAHMLGQASNRKMRALAWATAGVIVLVAAYSMSFGIFSFAQWGRFLCAAAEFQIGPNESGWEVLKLRALALGDLGILTMAQEQAAELGRALVALEPTKRLAAVTMALIIIFTGALVSRWRNLNAEQRSSVVILSIAGVGPVLLNALWRGGPFFSLVPLASILAISSVIVDKAIPSLSKKSHWGIFSAGLFTVVGIGGWNLSNGILPRTRLQENIDFSRTKFIKENTVASSWVITSGAAFPSLKVYLPYFAKRGCVALEKYFNKTGDGPPLAGFEIFVGDSLRIGIPVYLLSDLVDGDPEADALLLRGGVDRDRVMQSFGPGNPVAIARKADLLAIYLFMPDQWKSELAVGLAFNILYEGRAPREGPGWGALKKVVAKMSLMERARARALIRETDYGAKFLVPALTPFLGEKPQRRENGRGIAGEVSWGHPPHWNTNLDAILEIFQSGLKSRAVAH